MGILIDLFSGSTKLGRVPMSVNGVTADTDGNITLPYISGGTLAVVATTGSYNDLLNKPTIPAAQKNANWTATTGVTTILNKPKTLAGYGITDAVSSLTPTITKTSNYTLITGDTNTQINMNSTQQTALVLPNHNNSPIPVNSQLLVSRWGSGDVIIIPESGVIVRSAGNKTKISEQYAVVSLKKIANNEWHLVGALK